MRWIGGPLPDKMGGMKHPSHLARSAAAMVAEANEQVTRISVDELRSLMSHGVITLLDVRETGEHAAGTIPGAVCVPRGMLEFYADPACPFHHADMAPNRRYVLFCGSGGRSALAALTLQTMGYPQVAHLAGGIVAWRSAGWPTPPGQPS